MRSDHNEKSDFDKTIDEFDDQIFLNYINDSSRDNGGNSKGCGSLILDALFVVLVIWWILDMLLG